MRSASNPLGAHARLLVTNPALNFSHQAKLIQMESQFMATPRYHGGLNLTGLRRLGIIECALALSVIVGLRLREPFGS